MSGRVWVGGVAAADVRRGLMHGVYLTFFGNLIMAAILHSWVAVWPVLTLLLAHATLAAAVFAFLRSRPDLPAAQVNGIDALLMTPYYLSIGVAQAQPGLAGFDHLLVPKLLALGWATVVPQSYRLHALLILGLGAESLMLWYRGAEGGAGAAEPWFTILVVWMATSLLVLRHRQRAQEHLVVELRTRNAVLTEIAELFLRVRDRSNSPLQRLELASQLLERGRPASAAVVASIRESVAELEALHAQFREYEPFVAWEPEHLRLERSPDSRE